MFMLEEARGKVSHLSLKDIDSKTILIRLIEEILNKKSKENE